MSTKKGKTENLLNFLPHRKLFQDTIRVSFQDTYLILFPILTISIEFCMLSLCVSTNSNVPIFCVEPSGFFLSHTVAI